MVIWCGALVYWIMVTTGLQWFLVGVRLVWLIGCGRMLDPSTGLCFGPSIYLTFKNTLKNYAISNPDLIIRTYIYIYTIIIWRVINFAGKVIANYEECEPLLPPENEQLPYTYVLCLEHCISFSSLDGDQNVILIHVLINGNCCCNGKPRFAENPSEAPEELLPLELFNPQIGVKYNPQDDDHFKFDEEEEH